MAVRKLTTGKWICECYPNGRRGERLRKQFATKGEALSFERRMMQKDQVVEVSVSNTLKLSNLVSRWYEMHGQTLTSGKTRKVKLEAICERLGDPLVTDFDKNTFAVYREQKPFRACP